MSNSDAKAEELLRLLESVSDGSLSAEKLCEYHGVRGYLQERPEHWSRLCGDGLGRDNQQFRIDVAGFALKAAAFQESISAEFRRAGIRFLSLKGLSLSMLLYGEIGLREFGDLDLMVAPEDAVAAMEMLSSAGLEKGYPHGFVEGQNVALVRYGKAQSFCQPGSGVTLDLHWKLVSPWVGHDLLGFEELWARSQTLERDGLTPWRTLGNADTVVFLAWHGFQDGFCRLKQLLDLALALENLDYEWEELLEISGPRRPLLERAVELVVRLLRVEHPAVETVHFQDRQRALNYWRAMACAKHTPQSRLLEPALWSCPTWEALVRSAKAFFNPALDDIASVRLPREWNSLYLFVRCWRLLKKAVVRRFRTL